MKTQPMTTARIIANGRDHYWTQDGPYTIRIERRARGKYMIRFFEGGMNVDLEAVSGNMEEVAARIGDWLDMKTR